MAYSGDRLRFHITKQGRRIYWVAEQAGLNFSTLYRYLDGSRRITPESAKKLADVLEIDVSELEAEATNVA